MRCKRSRDYSTLRKFKLLNLKQRAKAKESEQSKKV